MLGEKGDTWNMEHWPHHLPHIQNRGQSGQKTVIPRWEDLALLPLLLCIDDRLYLPQGNMHQQPPQLSMEVIYRTFCDPTLTSFLQSKQHIQLKGKGAVVSTTELPHWAMQGKTEESLPQAVFCILLPSLDSPRWACEPGWLAVSLYNVWKWYQNSLLGSNKAKLTVAIRNKYMCNGFPATGLHMLAYLLKVSIYGESSQRLSQA